MFPEIDPLLTRVLVLALYAFLLIAPPCTGYVGWVWWKAPDRPLLFTALTFMLALGVTGGFYLGAIAVVRLVDKVVPPWAHPEASGVAAIMLLSPAVVLAWVIRRLRQ